MVNVSSEGYSKSTSCLHRFTFGWYYSRSCVTLPLKKDTLASTCTNMTLYSIHRMFQPVRAITHIGIISIASVWMTIYSSQHQKYLASFLLHEAFMVWGKILTQSKGQNFVNDLDFWPRHQFHVGLPKPQIKIPYISVTSG